MTAKYGTTKKNEVTLYFYTILSNSIISKLPSKIEVVLYFKAQIKKVEQNERKLNMKNHFVNGCEVSFILLQEYDCALFHRSATKLKCFLLHDVSLSVSET